MFNTTILIPAYGKIYANLDDAVKAWADGIDFRIVGRGQYCSVRNIATLSYMFSRVYIHLPNLKKSVDITPKL